MSAEPTLLMGLPIASRSSRFEANKQVRAMAERDGHAFGGHGRYTFTATEI